MREIDQPSGEEQEEEEGGGKKEGLKYIQKEKRSRVRTMSGNRQNENVFHTHIDRNGTKDGKGFIRVENITANWSDINDENEKEKKKKEEEGEEGEKKKEENNNN